MPVNLPVALQYFTAVEQLISCISTDLVAGLPDTLGLPGRVCTVPGPEVPWDGCECGQLAAAFQHGPYPSRTFPSETIDDSSIGNCQIGTSAVRVVFSLTRCEYHPPPKGKQGELPPTEAEQSAAARLMQIEAFVMRSALMCCLFDMKRNRTIADYRVSATDYSVDGGCGEVSIVVFIGGIH